MNQRIRDHFDDPNVIAYTSIEVDGESATRLICQAKPDGIRVTLQHLDSEKSVKRESNMAGLFKLRHATDAVAEFENCASELELEVISVPVFGIL